MGFWRGDRTGGRRRPGTLGVSGSSERRTTRQGLGMPWMSLQKWLLGASLRPGEPTPPIPQALRTSADQDIGCCLAAGGWRSRPDHIAVRTWRGDHWGPGPPTTETSLGGTQAARSWARREMDHLLANSLTLEHSDPESCYSASQDRRAENSQFRRITGAEPPDDHLSCGATSTCLQGLTGPVRVLKMPWPGWDRTDRSSPSFWRASAYWRHPRVYGKQLGSDEAGWWTLLTPR